MDPKKPLILEGAPALSPFRLEKMRSAIQGDLPGLTAIHVRYLHLADLAAPLDEAEREVLEALLHYGSKSAVSPFPKKAPRLLVVPRFGSITPWSSKATDIALHCGLDKVKRLERGLLYAFEGVKLNADALGIIVPLIHDRMTQVVLEDADAAAGLFADAEPRPLKRVNLAAEGKEALTQANVAWGLALSPDEIDYLAAHYAEAGRDPTDVELMMFAQVNSEHCRHKIFNADWKIDGETMPHSLFGMIRATEENAPQGTVVAYKDNASVIEGGEFASFHPDPESAEYRDHVEPIHILMKVETHNHPTAISPYPGAATGSGGEIRDEGATGRGSQPKAGLTGFSVSNLRLPDARRPWEKKHIGKPERIVSALEIMLEGPIGGAAFNNEFGRPNLLGYFRTFQEEFDGQVRGYHKPIMVAGGVGRILAQHTEKLDLPDGSLVIQIGGPAMLIGLGGGAASSQAQGASHEDLDFASVQRENPEIQRRAQEVINRCWQLGANNPIRSIHDMGAGGLSNAVPEIVHDAGMGGDFNLKNVPNADPGMSPMEIWCNEAQERYVLAIAPEDLEAFDALCKRENCPYSVLGKATSDQRLKLGDAREESGGEDPIDMEMGVLLGKPPKMLRDVARLPARPRPFSTGSLDLDAAARRVLTLPTVGDKTFLVTIGDRTVTGLVNRDQMVGPWQVPVADVAVTLADYRSAAGEAMAMGERTPAALLSGPASARLAVGEAVTNIMAASITQLDKIKLSANWMAAAGHPGIDAILYDTVEATMDLCKSLDIGIPVGKDSMSLKTVWEEEGEQKEVVAPLSLIISAFAPVDDAGRTLTPVMEMDDGETRLILIDLGNRKNRLGASALTQVYKEVGSECPDLDDPALLKNLFDAVQELNRAGKVLACHDRSDGGLLVTLLEMAFASRAGLEIDLDGLGDDPGGILFSEELGAVLQVRAADEKEILARLEGIGHVQSIGRPASHGWVTFTHKGETLIDDSRIAFHRLWSETTWRMQSLRDNPHSAQEEYDAILDGDDPGLSMKLTFDPAAPMIVTGGGGARPKAAILREQGVNGHVEMAAAFDRAGFAAVDVTMTDLKEGRVSLADFKGMVACGGFSFGDVLGAGGGWAKSILFNPGLKDQFAAFFDRTDTFTLGVCNGCQMLSHLRELIPGSGAWPWFVRNVSEQFEARFSRVEVMESPSILLEGMAGSSMPIAVAHGEGRAAFSAESGLDILVEKKLAALRFIDNRGTPAARYPANPNGSPGGLTGVTSSDGRVTLMMPHPERVFRSLQWSWRPKGLGEEAPWLRLFQNARRWVG